MDREAAEKALSAVNEASGQVAVAWASFLSVGTYLAVTVGSTTHLDLLIGKQITLPVLGVDLGLVTFYWAAPLLFLLFHVYFLIQLYALAGKIHTFNGLVAGADPALERTLRARLHIVMLTQALAGPRSGIVAQTVRELTLWLTAVVLPVCLLFLFLIRFLPYHDEAMTWWHRSAVILDVLFLFFLWPIIFHPSGAMRPIWTDARRWGRELFRTPVLGEHHEHVRGVRQSVVAVALVAAILLAMVPAIPVATIPEEWLERQAVAVADATGLSPVIQRPARDGRRMLAVTSWLFEGEIDQVTLTPSSLFARNLVIVQQDLVDDSGVEKLDYSLNLRGRRLDNAVFTGSDLHKADLAGAVLYRAVLRDANLQGARLACPSNAGRDECTSLVKAELVGVQLQGANLWRADLRDAVLRGAQFQAADLGEAKLSGDLSDVTFGGALLGGAQLVNLRGFSDETFAGASFANMAGYRDDRPSFVLHACRNLDESEDIRYVSGSQWPVACRQIPYPERDAQHVFDLYKQAASAVRDAPTRERVRRQLAALLKAGDACGIRVATLQPAAVGLDRDAWFDQWAADIMSVLDTGQCDQRALQELKGPAPAPPAGFQQTSGAPAP
jgi:uncharacterized protein YjbI with pentapeptide repeats/succinate dehydrogenase hydrophobic anchor subunit